MKENKISRRSFLKFGAAASAAGMMAAAPVAASAAQPDAAAAEDFLLYLHLERRISVQIRGKEHRGYFIMQ